MNGLIFGERYSVLYTLADAKDYQVYVVQDISNKKRQEDLLMIVYSNREEIGRFAAAYIHLKQDDCADFVGTLTEYGKFIAVFKFNKGMKIRTYFTAPSISDADRIEMCTRLLVEMMIIDRLPFIIKCPAVKEENIVIVPGDSRIRLNFAVVPEYHDGEAEALYFERIGQAMESIFPLKRKCPKHVRDFFQEVRERKFRSMAHVYSEWKRISDELLNLLEDMKRKNFNRKMLVLLKKRRIEKKAIRWDKAFVTTAAVLSSLVLVTGMLYFIRVFFFQSSIGTAEANDGKEQTSKIHVDYKSMYPTRTPGAALEETIPSNTPDRNE